jgi:hypothetical protein
MTGDKRPTRNTTEADEALRLFARLVAPYVAEELARTAPASTPTPDPGDYSAAGCARFVEALGPTVIERALLFFAALQHEGRIDSLELATLIGTTPRGIAGLLTTPLKRRAKKLRLDAPPWDGGRGAEPFGGIAEYHGLDPERTYWRDRDGIAERMVAALEGEQARRGYTS